jgi:hypothetical protein
LRAGQPCQLPLKTSRRNTAAHESGD